MIGKFFINNEIPENIHIENDNKVVVNGIIAIESYKTNSDYRTRSYSLIKVNEETIERIRDTIATANAYILDYQNSSYSEVD